jgi:hypothetical protein
MRRDFGLQEEGSESENEPTSPKPLTPPAPEAPNPPLEGLRETTPLPGSPGSPTLNLTPGPFPQPQPPALLRAPTLDLTLFPLPEVSDEKKKEEKGEEVEEEEKSKKEERPKDWANQVEKEKSRRIDRQPGTAQVLLEALRRRREAPGPPPPPVRVRALVPFKIKGMTVDSIIAVHGVSEEIPGRMIVTWDGTEGKKWDLPLVSVRDGAPTVEILDWQ